MERYANGEEARMQKLYIYQNRCSCFNNYNGISHRRGCGGNGFRFWIRLVFLDKIDEGGGTFYERNKDEI